MADPPKMPLASIELGPSPFRKGRRVRRVRGGEVIRDVARVGGEGESDGTGFGTMTHVSTTDAPPKKPLPSIELGPSPFRNTRRIKALKEMKAMKEVVQALSEGCNNCSGSGVLTRISSAEVSVQHPMTDTPVTATGLDDGSRLTADACSHTVRDEITENLDADEDNDNVRTMVTYAGSCEERELSEDSKHADQHVENIGAMVIYSSTCEDQKPSEFPIPGDFIEIDSKQAAASPPTTAPTCPTLVGGWFANRTFLSPFKSFGEILTKYYLPVSPSDDTLGAHQPFLCTGLGKLPPEVREEIWKDVILSMESCPWSWPKDSSSEAMSAVALSKRSSTSTEDLNPCPAFMKTCRLIWEEARPIYFANHRFKFVNGDSLLHFLEVIGPKQRNEITSLHIAGLTLRAPLYKEPVIEEYVNGNFSDEQSRNDARARYRAEVWVGLTPSAIKAAHYLRECNNLQTIFLLVKIGRGSDCKRFVLAAREYGKVVVDDRFPWHVDVTPEEYKSWRFQNEWIVRWAPEQAEHEGHTTDREAEWFPIRSDGEDEVHGPEDQLVEVDMSVKGRPESV